MNRVLIIQPGRKPAELDWEHGDYADWIARGMGLAPHEWLARYPHEGDRLPDHHGPVVITGSSAMVTDDTGWIRRLKEWLRERVDAGVPVLGICFGHQLLAEALGGVVRDNPLGVEVGTVEAQRSAEPDPLFNHLPDSFDVQASHRQSVIQLPRTAARLLHTAGDPNHAFRFGDNCWGIQFHPEFARRVMPAFVDYYAPGLAGEGVDVAALHAGLKETPEAARILSLFHERIKKTPVN